METNDSVLIQRCLENDPQAFECILNNHKNRIYSFMLRMTGNARDAEDIAQETFIKAFRNLKSYNSSYSFSAWLFGIARNGCIDFLRSKKRGVVSIDDENFKEIPDTANLIEEEVDCKIQQEKAEELIMSLPELYREVLLLSYKEELKGREIAEILRIPEGTVKVRLFRAKAFMKERLKTSGICLN